MRFPVFRHQFKTGIQIKKNQKSFSWKWPMLFEVCVGTSNSISWWRCTSNSLTKHRSRDRKPWSRTGVCEADSRSPRKTYRVFRVRIYTQCSDPEAVTSEIQEFCPVWWKISISTPRIKSLFLETEHFMLARFRSFSEDLNPMSNISSSLVVKIKHRWINLHLRFF